MKQVLTTKLALVILTALLTSFGSWLASDYPELSSAICEVGAQ